jgi:hypothetical protein
LSITRRSSPRRPQASATACRPGDAALEGRPVHPLASGGARRLARERSAGRLDAGGAGRHARRFSAAYGEDRCVGSRGREIDPAWARAARHGPGHASRKILGDGARPRLRRGRGRDGPADPVEGLGGDAAGAARKLAAEPEDHRQPVPGLQLPDQHHLGPGQQPDLQRRLPGGVRRGAPARPGRGLHRDLEVGLAGDRGAVRAGARGPHLLPREPAHVPAAQRLSRGDLLHLLAQPHPRRERRDRRPLSSRHRDHGDDAGRAAHAPAARPQRPHGRGAHDRRGLPSRHRHDRRARVRPALRAAVRTGRRRGDLPPRRQGGGGPRRPGGAADARGRRRRAVAGGGGPGSAQDRRGVARRRPVGRPLRALRRAAQRRVRLPDRDRRLGVAGRPHGGGRQLPAAAGRRLPRLLQRPGRRRLGRLRQRQELRGREGGPRRWRRWTMPRRPSSPTSATSSAPR